MPARTRGAVITYGSTATVITKFGDTSTTDEFHSAINNAPKVGGPRRMDRAIDSARNVFAEARPAVPKVVILFTTGNQPGGIQTGVLDTSFQRLYDLGARLYAVTISSEFIILPLRGSAGSDWFPVRSFTSLPVYVVPLARHVSYDTGMTTFRNIYQVYTRYWNQRLGRGGSYLIYKYIGMNPKCMVFETFWSAIWCRFWIFFTNKLFLYLGLELGMPFRRKHFCPLTHMEAILGYWRRAQILEFWNSVSIFGLRPSKLWKITAILVWNSVRVLQKAGCMPHQKFREVYCPGDERDVMFNPWLLIVIFTRVYQQNVHHFFCDLIYWPSLFLSFHLTVSH